MEPVGIDTLKIRLLDADIRANHKLQIPGGNRLSSGEVVGERVLWRHPDGREETGKNAFFNSPRFRFDVGAIAGSGIVGCYVTSELPAFIRGVNFQPSPAEEVRAVLPELEKGLREIGVHCNIEEAVLSRVDLARNVVADLPFRSYVRMLLNLEGERKRRRDYGDSILWHSGNREISVYDKILQLREVKEVPVSAFPPNVFRFELRAKNKRTISRIPGIKTAKDLIDGFEVLRQSYFQEMERNLFRRTVEFRLDMTEDEMIRRARILQGKLKGGYWRTRFFDMATSTFRPEQVPLALAVVEMLMEEEGASRATVKRTVRRMKARAGELQETLNFAEVEGGRTGADLFAELRNKVLEGYRRVA